MDGETGPGVPTPAEDPGAEGDATLDSLTASVEAMDLVDDAAAADADLNPARLADLLTGIAEDPLVTPVPAARLGAAIRSQIDALTVTEEPVPPTIDLDPVDLRAAVEGILLVSPRPLGIARLAECLPGADEGFLRGLLEGLADRYDQERRGWQLRRIGRGWQLLTRPEVHPWVRQLDAKDLPERLSRSAMETLAIVAYQQPITRGRIEDIRGVQSGPMLRQLMDLRLVQVVGRADDLLGHPLLYTTTESFLDLFGLGSLEDLPRHYEFGT
jgi:segregation and condensation protein B